MYTQARDILYVIKYLISWEVNAFHIFISAFCELSVLSFEGSFFPSFFFFNTFKLKKKKRPRSRESETLWCRTDDSGKQRKNTHDRRRVMDIQMLTQETALGTVNTMGLAWYATSHGYSASTLLRGIGFSLHLEAVYSIKFKKNHFYFIFNYMNVCVCMHTSMCVRAHLCVRMLGMHTPVEVPSLGLELQVVTWSRCWELNSCPLPQQFVCPVTEPSLQCHLEAWTPQDTFV